MADKKLTRQGIEYRNKMWTTELYNKKGEAFLVSPKHMMKKPVKAKKGG